MGKDIEITTNQQINKSTINKINSRLLCWKSFPKSIYGSVHRHQMFVHTPTKRLNIYLIIENNEGSVFWLKKQSFI